MNKKQGMPLPLLGLTTLMVSFALLILLVFALLALGSARSDARLTDSALQSGTEYYAADTAAEEIFARLRAGELPEGVSVDGGIYTYSCPVSQQQSLEVSLSCQNGEWTVLRWQTVGASGEAGEVLIFD